MDVEDVVRHHRPGLSAQQAAERLTRDGPNVVVAHRPTRLGRRVVAQLRDPLVLVLLAAAALTVVTGDHADAVIIAVVVVVNTVVGVAQEVRADQAVAALTAMAAPAARVVRDGRAVTVPAAQLVVGDLVELAEGDVVPADAQVVEAAALLVDESALTGESVPVTRDVSESLQAGSVVVHGRAVAVVEATGAASATGRIAAHLDAAPSPTPLQRRLAGLGRRLAIAAVLGCLVVLALGLARGESAELMIVTAISLVVAAVPESLPAVVTLALALGARRMAARHAVVRRLPAVETLGSVTVVATDKTGTLTEGAMVVEALWTPAGEATVTGRGYRPEGDVLAGGQAVDDELRSACAALLRAGVLCSDARLVAPGEIGGSWSVAGDPTEGAVLAAAAKLGLDRTALEAAAPRVAEQPFESALRRMTTVHRTPDGPWAVCKGAPGVVLADPVTVGDEAQREAARTAAAGYAERGYRVLAVAAGPVGRTGAEAPADAGRDLAVLGLIAIDDPPRAAAGATLAALRAAGIRPVLITGDHPATARAVAARLGIAEADVYARTSPEAKLDIVQAWRDAGHVVAMTGDGVNDGPALRRADIGVAMGGRGTEVARQAADLVLVDDDLATVVAAVEEGRRVYANVRRFLLYALAGGVAEIAVMLVGPAVGLALPLLPAQILWVNLITHGLPGVAFGAEPAPDDVLRRPPRPPDQSVLGDGLWQRIARTAAVIAAVTITVGVLAADAGAPWRTMVFLTLGAAQLSVALAVRARPGRLDDPVLLLAVTAALAAQLAGVYVPALSDLLGTTPLRASELGVALAACLPCYVVARVDRLLTDHRHARETPPTERTT